MKLNARREHREGAYTGMTSPKPEVGGAMKDVRGWVAEAVCIYLRFSHYVQITGNQVGNQFDWPQLLALSKLPPPPCVNRKPRLQSLKLTGVPKDALLSPCSLLFSVSQGHFPRTNLVPCSPFLLHPLFFSILLLFFSFNTGAEASAGPSPLAWGRGMRPLPRRGAARPRRSLRLAAAGEALGRLRHLAPRGWKALQTLAHHSLAEANRSAILTSIFQMGKWRHNRTRCGCRLAGSQGGFWAGSPDGIRGERPP